MKSYITESSIAKATLKIGVLRKTPMKASVKFAHVLCKMIVRCGNACAEKHEKKILIEGLQASVQSAKRTLRGTYQNTLSCSLPSMGTSC